MAIYRFYSWFTHYKMVIFYSYVGLSEGNGENDDWPISGRVAPAIGRDTPPVPFARTAAGAPPPPHLVGASGTGNSETIVEKNPLH